MCNLVDRLDSLGERGKHRQAEGGVRCETHRSAPASFRYAATNPLAKTSRALATKPVQGVNERWKKSKGNGDGRRAGLGLVRGGSRGGAVDGCVGGEHGADHSPAWGTNHDANKGGNSAQRAGGGANARPDDSADYKADQGMLAALGAGGCRDAGDVFAFYRDVGAVFFQGEQFIGDVPAIRLITRQISKSLDVGKLFF